MILIKILSSIISFFGFAAIIYRMWCIASLQEVNRSKKVSMMLFFLVPILIVDRKSIDYDKRKKANTALLVCYICTILSFTIAYYFSI